MSASPIQEESVDGVPLFFRQEGHGDDGKLCSFRSTAGHPRFWRLTTPNIDNYLPFAVNNAMRLEIRLVVR